MSLRLEALENCSRCPYGYHPPYLPAGHARDERDEAFLKAGVDMLAGFLEKRRAEKSLEQALEHVRRNLAGASQAIAMALEVRDPYTAGHQLRVTKIACAIAEEMGLSPERVEVMRMSAHLHDIGKIHVPSEILSKPGKLSPIEFEIIKTHSQVGYDILKNIDFAGPIAEIVYQHHEKIDGTGYPRGLKGDQILLDARILTVADVVEAAASHRPYRPALGIDKALDIIEQSSGREFDSKVVDACLRLFREKDFVL